MIWVSYFKRNIEHYNNHKNSHTVFMNKQQNFQIHLELKRQR